MSWDKVQCPLKLGSLGFIIWKFWGGLWEFVGCGLKELTLTDHGLVSLSTYLLRLGHCLTRLWCLLWGMDNLLIFWTDMWLEGTNITELVPYLFKAMPKRIPKKQNRTPNPPQSRLGVGYFVGGGGLTAQFLVQFLQVWDLVEGVVLLQEVPDQHQWKLTQSGCYTSKSWKKST